MKWWKKRKDLPEMDTNERRPSAEMERLRALVRQAEQIGPQVERALANKRSSGA